MRVTEIIADLHVEDLGVARAFYAEYLGLSPDPPRSDELIKSAGS